MLETTTKYEQTYKESSIQNKNTTASKTSG